MAEWKTAGKVRMTPKGTHNPALEYEILDIVNNTNGNKVYISKSDVPPNIQLTNTNYWVTLLDISDAYVVIGDSIATLSEAKQYLGIS